MFVSLIELNPARRDVQILLADWYRVHQLLSALFDSPKEERILFRVETPDDKPPSVLFQSREAAPEFQRLELKLSDLLRMPETKLFDPNLARGQKLGFRLLARPTKRIGDKENEAHGKRRSLREDDEKLSWLTRQGSEHGFDVVGCNLTHMPFWDFEPVHKGKQPRPSGPISATRFDGALTISNEALFSEAVGSGLGPQKGFGFGLLSLARH